MAFFLIFNAIFLTLFPVMTALKHSKRNNIQLGLYILFYPVSNINKYSVTTPLSFKTHSLSCFRFFSFFTILFSLSAFVHIHKSLIFVSTDLLKFVFFFVYKSYSRSEQIRNTNKVNILPAFIFGGIFTLAILKIKTIRSL